METPNKLEASEASEPNVKLIWVYFVALVLTLGALHFVFNVWFSATLNSEVIRKQNTGLARDLQILRLQAAEALGQYRWINRETGTVGLPIDRAMELIVSESAGRRQGVQSPPQNGEN